MSQLTAILFLAILQFFMGFGVLTLLRIQIGFIYFLALSVLLGIAVFSLVPFLVQLCYLPLSSTNLFIALITICALLNIKLRPAMLHLRNQFRNTKLAVRLYEVPFIIVICLIVFISVWRCFYFPPTPRDLTSGAEAIAEYAVKEKTMLNSIFTVDLSSTNNQFKPPFITSLQIIYKYAGFPFGQIWLSTVFISFIIFLYTALRQQLHPILTGLLILAFLAIPEMYGYTFMVLFDYSNAVYFFLSVYFMIMFFENREYNYLAFSALLMAVATYIRSETLVLACFMAGAVSVNQFRQKAEIRKRFLLAIMFLLPPALIYLLTVSVYIHLYLPVPYNIEGHINQHLANVQPFFERLTAMNSKLIFSNDGINYYGYFFFIFILLTLTDFAWKLERSVRSRNFLYGVLVIYLGMPFLGYLIPLMDLDNSTKRGLFKIFPLMLLCMANNEFLLYISGQISKWEKN